MALIQWTDALSVQVAIIDEQHKQLVQMINDLHDAMKVGRGRQAVIDILTRMADYVVMHFATEEKYMSQFRFPGLIAHKAEHQKFMNQVVAFQKDFEAGKSSVTMDLMNFLRDWLTRHIQDSDQKYGPRFKANGLKQTVSAYGFSPSPCLWKNLLIS